MTNRCETCPTIGDCKRAFGRYWTDRSHGGTGCDRRFEYRREETPRAQTAPAPGTSRSTARKRTTKKQEKLI